MTLHNPYSFDFLFEASDIAIFVGNVLGIVLYYAYIFLDCAVNLILIFIVYTHIMYVQSTVMYVLPPPVIGWV